MCAGFTRMSDKDWLCFIMREEFNRPAIPFNPALFGRDFNQFPEVFTFVFHINRQYTILLQCQYLILLHLHF